MWNQDLYKRALDFAARAHGDQKVPGSGFPYVVHVTKVAMEVLHATRDGALRADLAMPCALLHDCIEDGGPTWEAPLRAEFGDAVADGVRALSKDAAVAKPDRMADALRRIRAQPKEIWAVKLADRITNLEPPPPAWTPEKRRRYLAEAKQILDALRGASASLEERFEQKMREYEAYCGG